MIGGKNRLVYLELISLVVSRLREVLGISAAVCGSPSRPRELTFYIHARLHSKGAAAPFMCVRPHLLGCRCGGKVREALYLPLCDDVEGAALLSLPDDELSFVIVFLKDTRTTVRSEAVYRFHHRSGFLVVASLREHRWSSVMSGSNFQPAGKESPKKWASSASFPDPCVLCSSISFYILHL